jgi:predicted nucleic acid-binding protein
LTLVDTNILIDIAARNPRWADWSRKSLAAARKRGLLLTNVAVYAEFAIGFATQSACDLELARFDLTYSELTKSAAFRAVQAFRLYRGAGGVRTNVLADFLIGAHASVLGIALLTRDVKRYRTYFPELALLTP